jgi:hypothetical protein
MYGGSEHDVAPDHVQAMLVTNTYASKHPYEGTVQVVRGSLAFGLNHREQIGERQYQILLRLARELDRMDYISAPSQHPSGRWA